MAEAAAPATEEEKPKKKGKLLLIAIPVLLIALLAGLWFTGILPGLLGMNKKPPPKAAMDGKPPAVAAAPPVFVDVPDILANLNVSGKRPTYVKLHAKLELAAKSDEAGVTAAMPRIEDLFQTYLRDMRPDELKGAEGIYRLREELIARATIAVAPARVTDVLFTNMVVE